MEILRHHRTERHLRRDQRWRYEHLKSTDPVTLKTQHRVRGKNGKILTRLELAKEPSSYTLNWWISGSASPSMRISFEAGRLLWSLRSLAHELSCAWLPILSSIMATLQSSATCGRRSARSPITRQPFVTLIGGKRE